MNEMNKAKISAHLGSSVVKFFAVLTIMISVSSTVLAADCRGWNTDLFHKSANLEDYQHCIENGSNPNDILGGNTPLIRAIKSGASPLIVRELLALGADPNLSNSEIQWAPLDYAAQYAVDDLEIFELLIDAGADVNHYKFCGGTALITAVSFNSDRVVKLLLESGAKQTIDHKDCYHRTALISAARTSNPFVEDIIEILLEYNADILVVDDEGWTAWDHANARSDYVPNIAGSDAYWALKP